MAACTATPLFVAREPSGVSKESADAFDGEVRAADQQFVLGGHSLCPRNVCQR
jgi:hypothetical protein